MKTAKKTLLPRFLCKKGNRLVPAICLVLCLTLATAVVYAAFLGAGHRKGVAVANGYNFTSNVLNPIISEASALNTYYCADLDSSETSLDVYIRNYGAKKAPNPFTTTYTVKCKLNKEPPKADNGQNYYNYSVEYQNPDNGSAQTAAITSYDGWQTLGTNFTLGNEIDFDKFIVVFDRGSNETDISKAASVNFIAVPTNPVVMTSYLIGANIQLISDQAGFGYAASFEKRINNETASVSDLAGFLYEITTSGVISEAEKPVLRVTWQADKIDLSQESPYYGTVVYTDDSDGNHVSATLDIEVGSGEYITLAFYRTDDWDTSYTISQLKGFVTTTQLS